MAEAKCIKCGGAATGDSFEAARQKINHAVGLSRGIKCGDSYNRVTEIKSPESIPMKTPKTETPKPETSYNKPKEKKKTESKKHSSI